MVVKPLRASRSVQWPMVSLERLARKDQALLVRLDPLLVLDLRLDVLDRVRALDLQRDRIARKRLHEDLHGARASTRPRGDPIR